MSTISGANQSGSEFDYWEFVHCAVCFLPFVADPAKAPTGPPSVPFWLTECAHTLCNNHIRADQSCAACGAASIQLVPLQRDMMPPMSDWFRSVPHGLDTLANAAKSQQETMASLIRFYKRKCTQQRATIIKTKNLVAENQALRSRIEQLQQEISQLQAGTSTTANQSFDQQFVYGSRRYSAIDPTLAYEPSHDRNSNGKRPLADPHQNTRTSSPRSIITPVAPPRITLPPDHQQPIFPSGVSAGSGGRSLQGEETYARPGSSRFEQYAYQPPVTPLHAQPLRHHQQAPEQRRKQQQAAGRQPQHQLQAQDQQKQLQPQPQQQRMPPPPTPVRARENITFPQHPAGSRALFRPAGQALPQSAQQPQMQMEPPAPPPSTALSHQSRPSRTLQPRPFPMSVPAPTSHASSSNLPRTASHRSIATHANATTGSTNRTFAVPPTPSSNRFFSPRGSGGVVVGTPRGQVYPGPVAGGSARAPFITGLG